MPSAINANPGSASANSFVTETEASTYLDDRLNADAWNALAAGADNRLRALIEATRILTRLRYTGVRVDDVQILSWPRQFAINPDYPEVIDVVEGTGGPTPLRAAAYYPETEIPQRVKNATIELALEFLRAGTTDIAGRDAEREVIRKKVDVLETVWVSPNRRPAGLNRFPAVMREIAPLLLRTGSPGSLRIVRA